MTPDIAMYCQVYEILSKDEQNQLTFCREILHFNRSQATQ